MCLGYSEWLDLFAQGAVVGAILGAIPGLIVRYALGAQDLARYVVVAAALLMGCLFCFVKEAFSDCGSRMSVHDPEPVRTDSLYRSWVRFAAESDVTKRTELAHAIYCESARIRAIEPGGESALRETEARVAPRERFAQLTAAARLAYVPPARPTAHPCGPKMADVMGHVIDEKTGRPIGDESMSVVTITSSPHVRPVRPGGDFQLTGVPATGDSATVYVCTFLYALSTRRILVKDGEDQSIEVRVHERPYDAHIDDFAPCHTLNTTHAVADSTAP